MASSASSWLAGADEGAEMLISGLVNSGPILGYVYTKTSGKPHKVIRSSANIREVNRVYADIPEGDRQSCRTAIVNVQTACVHHELLCGYFRPYGEAGDSLEALAPGYIQPCKTCFDIELAACTMPVPAKPKRKKH